MTETIMKRPGTLHIFQLGALSSSLRTAEIPSCTRGECLALAEVPTTLQGVREPVKQSAGRVLLKFTSLPEGPRCKARPITNLVKLAALKLGSSLGQNGTHERPRKVSFAPLDA